MSTSAARSLSTGISGSRRGQDLVAPDPVRALLDRGASHEVYSPAEDSLELALHTGVIEETPLGVRREPHEEVHVAVGTEVGPQSRSEDGQLFDLRWSNW